MHSIRWATLTFCDMCNFSICTPRRNGMLCIRSEFVDKRQFVFWCLILSIGCEPRHLNGIYGLECGVMMTRGRSRTSTQPIYTHVQSYHYILVKPYKHNWEKKMCGVLTFTRLDVYLYPSQMFWWHSHWWFNWCCTLQPFTDSFSLSLLSNCVRICVCSNHYCNPNAIAFSDRSTELFIVDSFFKYENLFHMVCRKKDKFASILD